MKLSIKTALLFSTLSLAKSVPFNASYDDLFTPPAVGQLTPVGTYEGLTYSNFIVASLAILNISAGGILPHSDPNVALVNLNPGPINITASSKTKSFSLSNFSYGCDQTTFQGVVSIAKACTITATEYKAGSSTPVATQTFKFTPEQAMDLMNPLTFGTFSSSFKDLQHVNFKINPSILTVFIIDDFIGSTRT